MNEMAIEILNKMLIKEHFEGKPNEKCLFTKEELIKFSIKLLNEIKSVDKLKE